MRSPTDAGSFTLLADQRRLSMTAFVCFLVLAGSLSSLIAALLFCRLPSSHRSHTPSLAALFFRAFIYVCIGAATGGAGAWYYWRRFSSPFKPNLPLSFGLLALTNAAGWVWVPSVVLLIRQDSPATAAVAVIVAAIAATGLRKNLSAATVPLDRDSSAPESEETELFAESLRTPPRKAPPYVIAVCIYAAAFALFGRENLTASAPLALGTFLFAWELTLAPDYTSDSTKRNTRAALRLTCAALPAVLVTLFALLVGVAHRDHSGTIAYAHVSPSGYVSRKERQSRGSASEISSFESVVLWPFREKKQIVSPLPVETSFLAPGTTKPLVIRFDGSYWYFQAPNKRRRCRRR